MSRRIFFSYGTEVFSGLFGYEIQFESAGHGGGLIRCRVSKAEADRAMAGPDDCEALLLDLVRQGRV